MLLPPLSVTPPTPKSTHTLSLSLPLSLWAVIPHWHFHKRTFINFTPPMPPYANLDSRRRWIDAWVLKKPAWIRSQVVTKFFRCRTYRTWGVINMCAVKANKINNFMTSNKCFNLNMSSGIWWKNTISWCCISAFYLLPPSFHLSHLQNPSKDESCNLCYKFNYATIKGCDGKSYAEGKHSLFSLPPFRLGKLGHSIISQLVHLWAAKVIGDCSEISAVAKVAHSPQQSLEQNASMK